MSKASEFAERVKAAANRPEPFFPEGYNNSICSVEPTGNMSVNGYTLKPADALKLADWIYDTFGEGKLSAYCETCGDYVVKP